MSAPDRSHGRKSIRESLKPRALDGETPDLAGIWRADIITLFPDVFPGVLGASLTGKGLKDGKWQLHTHDLRPFGEGKHRNVDDTPAGGGAGMVMRADVLGRAISEVLRRRPPCPIIYMSPRGKPLTQARVQTLADGPGAVVLCGRFEGVDQRVIDHFQIEEVSIGDYVLSGGELAAQVMLDAAVRLLVLRHVEERREEKEDTDADGHDSGGELAAGVDGRAAWRTERASSERIRGDVGTCGASFGWMLLL